MFTNLRSLSIIYNKVDFKSFLPKMRCLNYLTVRYYKESFDDIYTQCITLRKLTFGHQYGDDEFNEFEKMIELVKQNQIPRTSPLNIVFEPPVVIMSAVKEMKRLEQDSNVG